MLNHRNILRAYELDISGKDAANQIWGDSEAQLDSKFVKEDYLWWRRAQLKARGGVEWQLHICSIWFSGNTDICPLGPPYSPAEILAFANSKACFQAPFFPCPPFPHLTNYSKSPCQTSLMHLGGSFLGTS